MTSLESDLEKVLSIIPESFHEQVTALPPDKLKQFLQEVLQADEVSYRQLTPEDIETIKARTQDGFQYGFRPKDVDFTWEELSQEGYISIGAFSNVTGQTAPVGFIVAEVFQISESEAYQEATMAGAPLSASSTYSASDSIVGIYFVGVDLEYRRQGIAHVLLDYIKQIALGAGARMMWLQVNDNNMPAVSFYESYGFKKTDEAAQGVKDKHYLYVMELKRKQPKSRKKAQQQVGEGSTAAGAAKPLAPPASSPPPSPSKGFGSSPKSSSRGRKSAARAVASLETTSSSHPRLQPQPHSMHPRPQRLHAPNSIYRLTSWRWTRRSATALRLA